MCVRAVKHEMFHLPSPFDFLVFCMHLCMFYLLSPSSSTSSPRNLILFSFCRISFSHRFLSFNWLVCIRNLASTCLHKIKNLIDALLKINVPRHIKNHSISYSLCVSFTFCRQMHTLTVPF